MPDELVHKSARPKPNYALKSYVLNNYPEALKIERQLSYDGWYLHNAKNGYASGSFDDCLVIEQRFDYNLMKWRLLELESESQGFDRKDLQIEVRRLNSAFYARLKRLRARVDTFVESCSSLWFLTLTFSDYTLSSLSADTRKRYIINYLSQYDGYVANIDYGHQNEREHYHALVSSEFIDHTSYTMGFICEELVLLTEKNSAVCKYVAKLTNHAVKETTKQAKLIYSRSKRK